MDAGDGGVISPQAEISPHAPCSDVGTLIGRSTIELRTGSRQTGHLLTKNTPLGR